MKDKYFTFLYIPNHNAGPRTLRVRRLFVYSLLGCLALALGVGVYAVCEYSGRIRGTYRFAALEKQNAQLRAQVDAFGGEIEGLRRNVDQNFDFQKKARLLANLDDLSADITEVGVGGPDFSYIQSLSQLDPETRENISVLRDNLDKLVRQAKLQRESYADIIDNMQQKSDSLRFTPSLRPVDVGFVSSRFGRRMDPITGRRTMHRGTDYSARYGTPVKATADGVVTFSGMWKTYGNVVELSHGNGLITRFAHMSKRLVRKGQKVRRGDIIGRVGATGKSTFTHLHYEVERDGKRVDPLKYVLAR